MLRTGAALYLLATLLLTACGSVPLTSYVALSRIDFSTTRLDELRVAVRLPLTIRPRPGGVEMQALVTLGDGPEEKTVFLLAALSGPAESTNLPDADPPGFRSYVYRLSVTDTQRFEVLRAGLIANKKAGKRGTLGLAIETREFCRLHSVPEGPLLATTYLRTSETGRYVVVSDRLDLRRDAAMAKELSSLQTC